jgi:Fe-S cluster biogenesis protein NfuA
MDPTLVDSTLVDSHVDELSRLMRAHGGGLELEAVAPDGTVRVRFTGMCTGCAFRPLTMAATVRRTLGAVAGVTRVEAVGSRISEQAEERLAALLSSAPNPWARTKERCGDLLQPDHALRLEDRRLSRTPCP